VTYVSENVSSREGAVIGSGYQHDICRGNGAPGNYLGTAVSQQVTSSNGMDTWARFQTTFNLPGTFSNPRLELDVVVDDVAQISVNGRVVGLVCHNDGSRVDHVTISDVEALTSVFRSGTNVLEFYVVNYYIGCDLTPIARGGEDGLSLEFEGSVSFK
jgi:hypothetical protein